MSRRKDEKKKASLSGRRRAKARGAGMRYWVRPASTGDTCLLHTAQSVTAGRSASTNQYQVPRALGRAALKQSSSGGGHGSQGCHSRVRPQNRFEHRRHASLLALLLSTGISYRRHAAQHGQGTRAKRSTARRAVVVITIVLVADAASARAIEPAGCSRDSFPYAPGIGDITAAGTDTVSVITPSGGRSATLLLLLTWSRELRPALRT